MGYVLEQDYRLLSTCSSQKERKSSRHDWDVNHQQNQILKRQTWFKAAYSVTFDLLILKIMFLFFIAYQEHSKNTQIQVNILPFS